MKTFLLRNNIDKWIHQNRADYTGDFVPGVLIDNFMVCTKRGYAAIYEKPLNIWQSIYRIEFEPFPGDQVLRRWCEFEEEANRQEQE